MNTFPSPHPLDAFNPSLPADALWICLRGGFALLFFFCFVFALFIFWHWAIAEGTRLAHKSARRAELLRNRKQQAVMEKISEHWRN